MSGLATQTTTVQLLGQLEDCPDDELGWLEQQIARRNHTPEFLRVCKVFVEARRYMDDDMIREIIAAVRGEAAQ